MTTQTAELQTNTAAQTRDLPVVTPATDIYETETGVVLFMDLPGVRQEQVDVTLENRSLEISARRDIPAPAEYQATHREFGSVEYRRAFTLSDNVDRSKISASLKNGVLRLTLPKAADAQPQKIAIQSE